MSLQGDLHLRDESSRWFELLRDNFCRDFEEIERTHDGPMAHLEPGVFSRTPWSRKGGGGGVMSLMRGRVFEKVGVNVSVVWGEFSAEFRGEIPGTTPSNGSFWASGISIVAHMQSPRVPGFHMNTRHIATTGKTWFGGGADLNPPMPHDKDTNDFHAALRNCCERHACADADRFKKQADDYFFIRHRKIPRGVGGIFFDYLEADPLSCVFLKDVGTTCREVFRELTCRNARESWTEEERQAQLVYRGRYAEFNLVQDRGTRFGLMTDGNPEAVLMSLPPIAAWP